MMKLILSFSLALVLSGCSLFVSEDSFGESWSGHHIDELISRWGKPNQKRVDPTGRTEVEYKIFSDSCTYHFFTDENGIITSYNYESTFLGTCKPIG